MFLIRNAFKRLHYPIDIIAQCVRWYLTYALNLRNREEMMVERGIIVVHPTFHCEFTRLTVTSNRYLLITLNYHYQYNGRVTNNII